MEEHSSKISQVFNGSIAIELTGKIMVITIIILFLIIAFVLILQLYTKWFRSSIDESTPSSHSHRRQESAVVRKGLEAAVLRSLPVVIYSPENFKDGLECAVCLSELTQGEKARFLPKCEHGFHVDCIDMWFQSNSTCPLCRNPISPISSNPLDSHLGEELESNDENSDSGSSLESPVFPTNVLFWGDETQVSSRGVCLEEGLTTSSSSSTTNARLDGIVAIDIPNEPSTSSGGIGVGCLADEETKTVVTTRLRTLKRLLSRERRGSNSNSPPIVVDIEQVGRGQS